MSEVGCSNEAIYRLEEGVRDRRNHSLDAAIGCHWATFRAEDVKACLEEVLLLKLELSQAQEQLNAYQTGETNTEQLEGDRRLLISLLEGLVEATGEGLEDDDEVLFEQIKDAAFRKVPVAQPEAPAGENLPPARSFGEFFSRRTGSQWPLSEGAPFKPEDVIVMVSEYVDECFAALRKQEGGENRPPVPAEIKFKNGTTWTLVGHDRYDPKTSEPVLAVVYDPDFAEVPAGEAK